MSSPPPVSVVPRSVGAPHWQKALTVGQCQLADDQQHARQDCLQFGLRDIIGVLPGRAMPGENATTAETALRDTKDIRPS
jgi:hypothetical protein